MKRLTYIFSLVFLLTLVSCASTCKEKVQEPVNWLEAPSLKEAFEGKFEIGFALYLILPTSLLIFHFFEK